MANDGENLHSHTQTWLSEPSPWVLRFAPLVKDGGSVLDVACGSGRHCRYFLEQAHKVVALDRSINAISDLITNPACEIVCTDLETKNVVFSELGKLAGREFDGIIVVNYLYRPLLNYLLDALAPDGVLIYETFARGNEQFGPPRNPEHLLESAELLDVVQNKLNVIAYEHGIDTKGRRPAVIQRICATKTSTPISKENDLVEPKNLFLG